MLVIILGVEMTCTLFFPIIDIHKYGNVKP